MKWAPINDGAARDPKSLLLRRNGDASPGLPQFRERLMDCPHFASSHNMQLTSSIYADRRTETPSIEQACVGIAAAGRVLVDETWEVCI